jgi:3-oxoacyl-[acyl-carrier protein] reductase
VTGPHQSGRPLAGQRVLVTAGGSGLGAAIARSFGAAGARVVVGAASAQSAQAVAGSIPGAVGARADMLAPADAQSLVGAAVERLGGLDILVNSVHGVPAPTPALDLTIEQFDAQINLNVRSMFLAVRHSVPHLGDGSAIVNLASTAARRPRPLLAAYNASVGSLITMTRGLAAELGPRIRVNAVCTSVPAARPGEPIPMGREADGDDVAAAALFLAAPRSEFLTGVCLEVTGGRDIE